VYRGRSRQRNGGENEEALTTDIPRRMPDIGDRTYHSHYFYPQANWLFAFPLLGIALIVFGMVTHKRPTPPEVAGRAEHLLDGCYGRWVVDDYEYLGLKSEQLKDLWKRTMWIGGTPEKCAGLDDKTKRKICEVTGEIRRLESTPSNDPT
jgi:hypothetical protein